VLINLQELRGYSVRPDPQALTESVRPAAQGDAAAQAAVCGAMLWASFAAPAAITQVFDLISRSQLSLHTDPAAILAHSAAPPEEFWQQFEATLTGPEEGYDATSITVAVASLGAVLDDDYAALSESAALAHLGSDNAADKSVPPMISLTALADFPDGSLARQLLSMWVDNGFDPEVLDRDAIGLNGLSPALRYLNTRILQMHDTWHLVAGYKTTSLHEMAISAFQLAQFGHNYSAMFLTTVCTMSHLKQPMGFPLLLQNLSEAWVHGCDAPDFMAIEWEQDWHMSIEEVRAKYGIVPFAGAFPADLLEQLSQAS
jgi:ubiquinone biosynthesis protein Coq4